MYFPSLSFLIAVYAYSLFYETGSVDGLLALCPMGDFLEPVVKGLLFSLCYFLKEIV